MRCVLLIPITLWIALKATLTVLKQGLNTLLLLRLWSKLLSWIGLAVVSRERNMSIIMCLPCLVVIT